jgi:dCTP diphosphatase
VHPDPNTLEGLTARIESFTRERGWDDVRTAKDLAAAISIEASELQELFLWVASAAETELVEQKRGDIASELADVVIYAIGLASKVGIDLGVAVSEKLDANALRFPAGSVTTE